MITIDIPADRIPPLQHGRYRLYTVDVLPFDALPAYEDGGPQTVTLPGFYTSTYSSYSTTNFISKTPLDGGQHTLCVTVRGSEQDHPLHGTKYATSRDADRAAYNARVLGFLVRDDDAAAYGLPTPTA